MKVPRWSLMAAAVGILCLAGCEAERLARRGNQALEAGRGAQAVHYLEAAAREEPRLREQPEFRTRLERARYLKAYQSGVRLLDTDRAGDAIAHFERALRLRPGSAEATRRLAAAKRKAAKDRHERALAAADKGDLDAALAELRAARRLDPENESVRRALGSLGKLSTDAGGRADAIYHQAVMLTSQNRWRAAAATFKQAVELDRNHLPSRAELRRSNDRLRDARSHYREAVELLRKKSLDRAIASLERALSIWPNYEDARRTLADAKAQREEAELSYESAARHFEAERWDEAIAAGDDALAVFPFHKPAQRVIWEARQAAADRRTAEGENHLAAGRLEEADAAFKAALSYYHLYKPAKEGLARADRRRGGEAERNRFWGAAMLHYMNANEHVPEAVGLERLGAARARIRERIAFRAELRVGAGLGDRSPASVALRDAVNAELARRTPGFLRIVTGRAAGAAAEYVGSVRPVELRIDTRPVATEQHVHVYVVGREVPNPEVPRLRHALGAARRRLARLRRDAERPCNRCNRRGDVKCAACGGDGRIGCGLCSRDGRYDGKRCPRCRGQGFVRCKKCGGSGRVPCRACGGRGRGPGVSRRELRAAEHRLDHLRHQLAATPPVVVQEFEEQWPFTVTHHERFGEAEARLEVTRVADGARLASEPIREGVAYRDATIDNPNPAVGLGEDPLQLPPEGRIQRELIGALAGQAAEKLVAALVEARIADLRAEADRLRRAGHEGAAMELDVDAATLIEHLDGSEAKRMLADLRRRLAGRP